MRNISFLIKIFKCLITYASKSNFKWGKEGAMFKNFQQQPPEPPGNIRECAFSSSSTHLVKIFYIFFLKQRHIKNFS